jgi:hypothetical protein
MKMKKSILIVLSFCAITVSAFGNWDNNPNNWKNNVNNWENSPNNWKNNKNNWKNNKNNYNSDNGLYGNDGKRAGYCVGNNCYSDDSGDRIGYGFGR